MRFMLLSTTLDPLRQYDIDKKREITEPRLKPSACYLEKLPDAVSSGPWGVHTAKHGFHLRLMATASRTCVKKKKIPLLDFRVAYL